MFVDIVDVGLLCIASVNVLIRIANDPLQSMTREANRTIFRQLFERSADASDFGAGDALGVALLDQAALKFADGGEHVEQQPAVGLPISTCCSRTTRSTFLVAIAAAI